MRLIASIFALALLASPGSIEAQSLSGALQLTPQQKQYFDSLPADQRAEIMRQVQQLQAGTPDAGAAGPGGAARAPAARAGGVEQLGGDSDEVIQPDDTLVIDINFPPATLDELSPAEPRQHLLLGRRTAQLDTFGRLSLPGLAPIALAGLRSEQAELRLMAEPSLSEMVVQVRRLDLQPVGRDALKPFGHDVFRRAIETATDIYGLPVSSHLSQLPAGADYVVGPGDHLRLTLFGKSAGIHDAVVTNEGEVNVPELGPVAVAGLKFTDAKDLIERRVREETIGMQVSVSMGTLRSLQVLVLGEVVTPGLHSISGTATVLSALYTADGISEIGSMRDVRVVRAGEVQGRYDLYDLLLEGRATGDIRLQAGDVVFVPATGPRAGVTGEALRSAWFEFTDPISVGRLLEYAGGPSGRADLRLAQIERQGDDGRIQFIDVDAASQEGRGVMVQAGDILHVPRTSLTPSNAVTLRGHFANPGPRAWREGLRLSDLLDSDAALQPEPDLDYGIVVRRLDDGRGIGIEMFSPRAVLERPDAADNITLRPRDEVLMFSFEDPLSRRALIEPLVDRLRRQATQRDGARVVRVTGAVRIPGFYPLADGMTLSDLTRAGGGLTEAAYRGTAEVTRYETSNGVLREIEHVEVDFADVADGTAGADLQLRPHDVLNIKEMPQWSERGVVELRGEIRFPGTYPIRPGETLAQILERAGGLTQFAFPRAAVFTRESLREREQQQIDNMVRRLEADVAAAAAQGGPTGAQAQAIAGSLVEQLKETRAAGRLVIDLPRLIRSPGSVDYDVLVHDGDTLIVPPRPQEVTVLGEVYFPTSHIYDPDLRGNEYLQRSGGMTQRADARRIYVVRASGAVETAGGWRSRLTIEPGDTIVVPLDAERLPTMVRVMNISQILYQLAITAAALQTIGAL